MTYMMLLCVLVLSLDQVVGVGQGSVMCLISSLSKGCGGGLDWTQLWVQLWVVLIQMWVLHVVYIRHYDCH